MLYPLAPQGVFLTVQGEGAMLGVPQVFVRLAGCNVNCLNCDTDYTVAERVGVRELVRRVVNAGSVKWVWVTGGEPTIHDLVPLVTELRAAGFSIALATAGTAPVPRGHGVTAPPGGLDFVSVSPHFVSDRWVQRRGDQLNVVPGLNGIKLSDLDGVDVSGFTERFVTPLFGADVSECAEWVMNRSGWRLGVQAHRYWGIP